MVGDFSLFVRYKMFAKPTTHIKVPLVGSVCWGGGGWEIGRVVSHKMGCHSLTFHFFPTLMQAGASPT